MRTKDSTMDYKAHILKLEERYRNLPHKTQVSIWNRYAISCNQLPADEQHHIYTTHTLNEIELMLGTLEATMPKKEFKKLFT